MKTISAYDAFGLFFELFKAHPWLNEPGGMGPQDSYAEDEALAFLLSSDLSKGWNGCSEAARRVVNGLLLDFMAKLQSPESAISRSSWDVDDSNPAWRQALEVVVAEIRRNHPHCAAIH
ncbi:hypothetical protein [Stutzerimonas nitrititolerans]|uniref:hypothetical protein n=1 Tax=Stutzerimonas nitrititolerans TaxID=2482751 RepID=UPI0028AB7085|nr:hypothetical protein [Stutzerimonas nitrititolerans]